MHEQREEWSGRDDLNVRPLRPERGGVPGGDVETPKGLLSSILVRSLARQCQRDSVQERRQVRTYHGFTGGGTMRYHELVETYLETNRQKASYLAYRRLCD